jgi:hypothetical protein
MRGWGSLSGQVHRYRCTTANFQPTVKLPLSKVAKLVLVYGTGGQRCWHRRAVDDRERAQYTSIDDSSNICSNTSSIRLAVSYATATRTHAVMTQTLMTIFFDSNFYDTSFTQLAAIHPHRFT